jgi:hypothetical protein
MFSVLRKVLLSDQASTNYEKVASRILQVLHGGTPKSTHLCSSPVLTSAGRTKAAVGVQRSAKRQQCAGNAVVQTQLTLSRRSDSSKDGHPVRTLKRRVRLIED